MPDEAPRSVTLTEDQLRHARSLQTIGLVAAGVAHDFNNVLSVIVSHCSLLLEDAQCPASVRERLLIIDDASHRAADLTRQLLALARPRPHTLKGQDLNPMVLEATRMLGRVLRDDIRLVTRVAPAPLPARVEAWQICQIVLNLASNAQDAMPDGGTLIVETTSVSLDEAETWGQPDVLPGTYAVISVSDTGVGMSSETRARVFEPFFTTKPQGQGTGLGLALTLQIVKQLGGRVSLKSDPGEGTTVCVYVPTREPHAPFEAETQLPAELKGDETVLVVEDNAGVRRAACDTLRHHGYHVLEACNAGEALLVCEQYPEAIGLLVTDIVMPRMSGRTLAGRLTTLRPSMRVLFMSGYQQATITSEGILTPGSTYVEKPLVPQLFARRVRETLDLTRHH